MSENPLKQYFRQPMAYVKLPTQGRWYKPEDVTMNAEGSLAVYPMGAIDDILINTPDAMLNGQSLEKVIKNCVPEIKNVKKLLIPDLEVVLFGIKVATSGTNIEYEKKCPKCDHENLFDFDGSIILDAISTIDPSQTVIEIDNNLIVHIRPYDFEMKQLFIKKEFEEERALRTLEASNKNLDELQKANLIAESVQKIASLTFGLVSRSIEKIVMKKENIVVSDPTHISEWLTGISKEQSEIVINAVNILNLTGIQKSLNIVCQNCGHSWTDNLNFDPTSFFGKRSRQGIQI